MSEIDYRKHIEKAIDYIESNLKNDIDNATLARIAGYSEYHFLRIFRETVHLTPADYIRKRRISEIVRHMMTESVPIVDLAFEYGFHSAENFTRAFRMEHHISPSTFRMMKNSLKLYDRMRFSSLDFCLEVSFLYLEPFTLVVYPCHEKSPPNFWNQYNTGGWSKRLSGGNIVEDFGVSDWNIKEKKLYYYIGIRESEARGDLSGTIRLSVGGGLYAVFETPKATYFDFVNTIHRAWDYIKEIWLPENGFQRTGGYELESYIEESRIFSEKIYIPIMGKEKAYEKIECNI